MKNISYLLTVEEYLSIVELGKRLGVKEGESMLPALNVYQRLKTLKRFESNKELVKFIKDGDYKSITDLRDNNNRNFNNG